MKKVVLAAISVLFLTGAIGFGSKFKKLEPGMTREQVINILGRPDEFYSHESVVGLSYANKMVTFASMARADYYVVLVDNVVVEYGIWGAVRERPTDPNAFFAAYALSEAARPSPTMPRPMICTDMGRGTTICQ